MQINLGIGLPLVETLSHTSFWDSWVRMERPDFVYLRPKYPCHPNMDEIRNSLVDQAVETGCSHLLMLDTDQIYPVDTVTRLVEWARTGIDIVTARVHRRYPPFDPLLMRRAPEDNDKYIGVPTAEWERGGLVEVDATGAGCMLINLDILDTIEWPWFEICREEVSTGGYKVTGEDVRFCQKARAAGHRIFVDCGLDIGHVSELIVNAATFHVYQKLENAKTK